MKRTINSTGRRRVPLERISVRLISPTSGQGAASFTFQLGDVSDLKLPPSARVYLEPYVGSSLMRFDLGSVERPVTPVDTTLSELDAGGSILFRLKIVDESDGTGRILAAAEEVAPVNEDDATGRKPLLPIRPMDLQELLWKVEVRKEAGPRLLISNRLIDFAGKITTDPFVQGLVLPKAIGEVLLALFSLDEEADWARDWMQFAELLRGEDVNWELDPIEDSEEIADLVATLVRVFATRQQYVARSVLQRKEALHG